MLGRCPDREILDVMVRARRGAPAEGSGPESNIRSLEGRAVDKSGRNLLERRVETDETLEWIDVIAHSIGRDRRGIDAAGAAPVRPVDPAVGLLDAIELRGRERIAPKTQGRGWGDEVAQ